MNKYKRGNRLLIAIPIILFLIIIITQFIILKPCSRIFLSEEIIHNISEYPFYELDISNNVFPTSRNANIIVRVDYIKKNTDGSSFGTSDTYLFVKEFDFKKLGYIWKTSNFYNNNNEVKIIRDIKEKSYSKSNNVLFLIPIPKDTINQMIIAIYSGICNK